MRSVKSISLPLELMEIIENFIPEFSQYVQDRIKEDFILEYLKKKNEEDLKKINERKILIKKLEKINKPEIKMSNEEKTFLNWAKNNLKVHPGELYENCRVYNLKFGKRLTQQKFKELVK